MNNKIILIQKLIKLGNNDFCEKKEDFTFQIVLFKVNNLAKKLKKNNTYQLIDGLDVDSSSEVIFFRKHRFFFGRNIYTAFELSIQIEMEERRISFILESRTFRNQIDDEMTNI